MSVVLRYGLFLATIALSISSWNWTESNLVINNQQLTQYQLERQQGELTILPGYGRSPVNLDHFPEPVTLTFALRFPEAFVASIDPAEIILHEDGHKVETVGEVEPLLSPMVFVIIFDIGGPGASMVSQELFEKVVDQVDRVSVPGDAWLFCSTKLDSMCLGSYSENNGEINPDPIYTQLARSAEDPEYVPLALILRRALALSDNLPTSRVIIVAKQRTNALSPYIPDALVTDLLLHKTPVTLLNFTEANDTQDFKVDTQARLGELNGSYFTSGGQNDWDRPNGLVKVIQENRPTQFRLAYRSQLFRDNDSHEIIVGYQSESLEAWGDADFRFTSLWSAQYSTVTTFVEVVDGFLLFGLPVLLLFAIVIVTGAAENNKPESR